MTYAKMRRDRQRCELVALLKISVMITATCMIAYAAIVV